MERVIKISNILIVMLLVIFLILVVLLSSAGRGFADIISEIHPEKATTYYWRKNIHSNMRLFITQDRSDVVLKYNLYGTTTDKIKTTTLVLKFKKIIKEGDIDIYINDAPFASVTVESGTFEKMINIDYGDNITLRASNGFSAQLDTPLLRLTFEQNTELQGYESLDETHTVTIPPNGYNSELEITCSSSLKKLLNGGAFIRGYLGNDDYKCISINSSFHANSFTWKTYFINVCDREVTVYVKMFIICAEF